MLTDLVPVKVVPHHTQPPCPQQVSLHQLLAGLHIAAQPHTHQRQVLPHGEEVTALQEARLVDVAGNGQPWTPAGTHSSDSDTTQLNRHQRQCLMLQQSTIAAADTAQQAVWAVARLMCCRQLAGHVSNIAGATRAPPAHNTTVQVPYGVLLPVRSCKCEC